MLAPTAEKTSIMHSCCIDGSVTCTTEDVGFGNTDMDSKVLSVVMLVETESLTALVVSAQPPAL